MPGSLIIAAPPGPTRRLLERHFGDRCARVVSLARERLGASQQPVLEDDRVWLDGEEILTDAAAALIVDSGYMWPLPSIDPTPEQWTAHRGRVDEFLRDERESASFWYSLLEIIGDRVPVCINPQAAFELEALKPFAFELLREEEVRLPPLLTTNDPEAVTAFRREHGGELLATGLAPGASQRWIDGNSPDDELDLDRAPLLFQSVNDRERVIVTAVAGRVVAGCGKLDDETIAMLPVIQRVLRMPWATLVFRRAAAGTVLSDFSPSPDLGTLSEEEAGRVLEALARSVDL